MKRFVQVLKAGLALLLVVSLAFAAKSKRESRMGIQSYEQARKVARLIPDSERHKLQTIPSSSVPEEPQTPQEKLAQIDLAALQAVNPDVVGWIEIPDTELSYPLVQQNDNAYYLNRTWDRTRNSSGSIFMDYTCSPALDDFHTIIYGHRMNDDTMFGTLKYYREPDFWPDHPSVYVATADGVYRYDLFSAQEADIKGVIYRLDLRESHLEEEFFQYCRENAVVNTLQNPTADDRILTLSTCTGSGHATRWVVHGVLAEVYERPETGS